MALSYRAYNRLTSWPSDNNNDHSHAHNMEQRKNTTDELYALCFIAGLCNQEPRDQDLLDDMLMYLRGAQEKRLKQNETDP
jgi:hypothetical protein